MGTIFLAETTVTGQGVMVLN